MVIQGHVQSGENLICLMRLFSADVEQNNTLPSCLGAHCKQVSFAWLFGAMFFAFLCSAGDFAV